jgi:hypothetical protein
MPSPPTPRGGLMGGDLEAGEGGFPGSTSLSRGTTHARFGSEVERKASNLVAHLLPAERSSSRSEGRQVRGARSAARFSGIHASLERHDRALRLLAPARRYPASRARLTANPPATGASDPSVLCFRVSSIVLLPLDVGLHVGRRHQPNGVPQRLKLSRPMV